MSNTAPTPAKQYLVYVLTCDESGTDEAYGDALAIVSAPESVVVDGINGMESRFSGDPFRPGFRYFEWTTHDRETQIWACTSLSATTAKSHREPWRSWRAMCESIWGSGVGFRAQLGELTGSDGLNLGPPNPTSLTQTNAPLSSWASTRDQLLTFLKDYEDCGIPIIDLPEQFWNSHLLEVLDADRLIEFGHRNHVYVQNEVRIETGWDYVSVTGPDCLSMTAYLDDIRQFTGDPRLREHIRLTAKGRVEASRVVLNGGTDERTTDFKWSQAMSKAEMARRILKDRSARFRKVKPLLDPYQMARVTARTWRVRIDQMDSTMRQSLETPLQ